MWTDYTDERIGGALRIAEDGKIFWGLQGNRDISIRYDPIIGEGLPQNSITGTPVFLCGQAKGAQQRSYTNYLWNMQEMFWRRHQFYKTCSGE